METPHRIGLSIGCALVPFLMGVCTLVFGVWAFRMSLRMDAEPQIIRCADLIANGPGDNAHVLITDYEVVADAAATQPGLEFDDPDVLWVPIRPVGEKDDAPFRVILIHRDNFVDKDIERLAANGRAQGTVENIAGFLTSRDKDFLQANFAQTVDHCWVIERHELGYSPPSSGCGLACAGVGGGLALISVVFAAMGIRGFGKRRTRPTEFHTEPAPISARGAVLQLSDAEPILAEPVVAESVAATEPPAMQSTADSGAAGDEIVMLEDAEPGDLVWFKALSRRPRHYQKGIVILRPECVAFLPTAKEVNTLAESAGLMAAGAGFVSIRPLLEMLQSPSRMDELLAKLWRMDPSAFDENLRDATRQFGGSVWPRNECQYTRSRGWGGKQGLSFCRDRAFVGGTLMPSPALDRLLAEWSPMPIKVGRVALGFSLAATIPTIIALVLFVISATRPIQTGRDQGPVTIEQALDPRETPAGNVVEISGHPDLERALVIDNERGDGHTLFVLEESPSLIVFCYRVHPFSQAVRRSPTDPEAAAKLEQEWTYSGRIYDPDDTEDCGCDTRTLRRFATGEIGLAGIDETRILAVGQRPRENDSEWTHAAVFYSCIAGLLWLLVPVTIFATRRRDLYERNAWRQVETRSGLH